MALPAEMNTGISQRTGNEYRLLWAGFMAILASGVGFSIRSGILADWGREFGFTQSTLGQITGGGLLGFGIIIIIGSLLADAVGYGKLMILAFLCHFASAVLTLAASPAYRVAGQDAAFQCLYWGMFLFAIGNGIAEAVVNPLTAALFPSNKTHYLNILHAGWPGGLIVGGLLSFFLVGKVPWQIQISMFLIPVVIYGAMCLGQRFPTSEASAHGVSYVEMLRQLGLLGSLVICVLFGIWFTDLFRAAGQPGAFGIAAAAVLLVAFGAVTGFEIGPPMLAFLLIIHAMVGYVELGTDSWISNITGNILESRERGLLLFVYTSGLMFALRFFAGPIVHQISPLGLLFLSAVFAACGLYMLGNVATGLLLVIAATVYGLGKTFFWPTMLGVVSEQFPKGGAITIGSVGGVGMLAAGLLGGPGIGYKQDYYASTKLQAEAQGVYEAYRSETKNQFLIFPEIQGLDGTKVQAIRGKEAAERTTEERKVHEADLYGGRQALKLTALVPTAMAVCYLALIFYFRTRGGYSAEVLVGHQAEDEKFTGGVAGPVE